MHTFLENFKSQNKEHYLDNLTQAKTEGLLGSPETRQDSSNVTVTARIVDQLGKQHDIG